MNRTSKRIRFENDRGDSLAGVLEWPAETPKASAIFSHCFTCGKDLKTAVRICRRLAARGVAALRFDFAGIGESKGDFESTNLTTQVQDLLAAARYLAEEVQAPGLLMGHSLGGTASVLAADQIPSVQCLATVASPGSTERLANFLAESNRDIERLGEGHVNIGGSNWLIRRQLLDDLRRYDIAAHIAALKLPILIFHSPEDETVPWSWALRIFESAGGHRSFVTLDGADHLLLSRPGDAEYVAEMIAAWSTRYLGQAPK